MNANVNLEAPIGALLFAATALILSGITAAFLFTLIRGNRRLANVFTVLLMSVVGSYLVLLVAFSLASKEKILSRGQEKHFCELDCHIAYSIADVMRVKSLTTSDREMTARGFYYVVGLKTRFDENTITPTRGNGLLYPKRRAVAVVDDDGHHHVPLTEIDSSSIPFTSRHVPIITPLRPGESYISIFVFDLPQDVKNPTLLISESAWPTYLVVGRENSLWHGKTRLQL